jgi:hypothetical protein
MRNTTTQGTVGGDGARDAASPRRRRRVTRSAIAALALVIALPAAAIAGKKATAGTQTLQIKAHIVPARAGAKPAALKLHVDYESTTNQHNSFYEHFIRVTVPRGFRFHPAGIPKCSERALSDAHDNAPAACPPGSRVGGGTVTADARPTLQNPVPATVTVYSGRYDCSCFVHPPGAKRSSEDLIIYVRTSLGLTITQVWNVLPNQSFAAYFNPPPPPSQRTKGLYALKTIDLTLKGPDHKPFIQAPRTCNRSWAFAMTIANYDGPNITAHDKAACSSGTTRHHSSAPTRRGDRDHDGDDR